MERLRPPWRKRLRTPEDQANLTDAVPDPETHPSSPPQRTGTSAPGTRSSPSSMDAAQGPSSRAISAQTEREKAGSTRRTTKFAFFSGELVLRTTRRKLSDIEEFDELLGWYLDHYQPEGPVEVHQIELAVGALWGYRRLLRAATRGVRDHKKQLADSFESGSSRSLTKIRKHRTPVRGSEESERLQRQQAHFLQVYYRALSELARLQRRRLGDNPLAPIAVIISMGRVAERSGDITESQGAGPRDPKRAAIPESSLGEDQSPGQQATSRFQRPQDHVARDGLERPRKGTPSQVKHRS